MQPWCTPFPIWNQSIVPCPVLTVASWPACRFLRRQVRRSSVPISWRIFYSLLWSTQSKVLVQSVKQENFFLKFSSFRYDPTDVGNLIFGSSAFSKSALNIWSFIVHVLLKPSLKNFEHCFASVWDGCNCAVAEHSFAFPFFGIGMKIDLFQSCSHCWVFQISWHIECSYFTVSSFRIWNRSTRILSPPLICSDAS